MKGRIHTGVVIHSPCYMDLLNPFPCSSLTATLQCCHTDCCHQCHHFAAGHLCYWRHFSSLQVFLQRYVSAWTKCMLFHLNTGYTSIFKLNHAVINTAVLHWLCTISHTDYTAASFTAAPTVSRRYISEDCALLKASTLFKLCTIVMTIKLFWTSVLGWQCMYRFAISPFTFW